MELRSGRSSLPILRMLHMCLLDTASETDRWATGCGVVRKRIRRVA